MFGRKKRDFEDWRERMDALERHADLTKLVGKLREENSKLRESMREVQEFMDEYRGDEFTLNRRQLHEVIEGQHRVFEKVHMDKAGLLIRNKRADTLHFTSDVKRSDYTFHPLMRTALKPGIDSATFGPFEIEVDEDDE